jgi:hypothetical protein
MDEPAGTDNTQGVHALGHNRSALMVDFDILFIITIETSFLVMIGDVDEGDMHHLVPGK